MILWPSWPECMVSYVMQELSMGRKRRWSRVRHGSEKDTLRPHRACAAAVAACARSGLPSSCRRLKRKSSLPRGGAAAAMAAAAAWLPAACAKALQSLNDVILVCFRHDLARQLPQFPPLVPLPTGCARTALDCAEYV